MPFLAAIISPSTATQLSPTTGLTSLSLTSQPATLALSPGASAVKVSDEKPDSAAIPKTLTAKPKCAMTMPNTGIGVRSSLRPLSGIHAATARADDNAMPKSGNIPISGANFHIARQLNNKIAAAPISQYFRRPRSSRRQRNRGPTNKASIKRTAIGTVALLKYGGPTDILSPNASAAIG